MNFPLYIAKRYLFSKSSTNAINIITLIAMFGVIVGTLALFVILSGFSGLRTFSDSFLEASDPDIKISPVTGKKIVFTKNIQQILEGAPEVACFSKVVEERAFLQYKNKQLIAFVKGVDENFNKVVAIDSVIDIGSWLDKNFTNTAVIGNGISFKLSLGVYSFGEPLQIIVPKPGKGFVNIANAFNSQNVQISGIYSGTEEFQNKYVFTNVATAQKLLKYSDTEISAIELKVANTSNLVAVKNQLQNKLGNAFKVQTKQELNALYYRVMNTENFVVYLIFTLIVIIALFNVIGAIIMMIIDKRKNLKTLYNLGTTVKNIKKIFVLQGFLLTLVGLCIGLFIGIILVIIQQQFELFMITQNIPYPVEFQWTNLLVVIFTITILGYLASKLASSRISASFIEK